jgi:hypothetical protein
MPGSARSGPTIPEDSPGLRLLPGEPQEGADSNAARLWIQIYEELIQMKELLLATLEFAVRDSGEAVRSEASLDRQLLRGQKGHYEERLRFWQDREKDLS